MKKKIIAVLVSSVMVLSLGACGNKEDTVSDEPVVSASETSVSVSVSEEPEEVEKTDLSGYELVEITGNDVSGEETSEGDVSGELEFDSLEELVEYLNTHRDEDLIRNNCIDDLNEYIGYCSMYGFEDELYASMSRYYTNEELYSNLDYYTKAQCYNDWVQEYGYDFSVYGTYLNNSLYQDPDQRIDGSIFAMYDVDGFADRFESYEDAAERLVPVRNSIYSDGRNDFIVVTVYSDVDGTFHYEMAVDADGDIWILDGREAWYPDYTTEGFCSEYGWTYFTGNGYGSVDSLMADVEGMIAADYPEYGLMTVDTPDTSLAFEATYNAYTDYNRFDPAWDE